MSCHPTYRRVPGWRRELPRTRTRSACTPRCTRRTSCRTGRRRSSCPLPPSVRWSSELIILYAMLSLHTGTTAVFTLQFVRNVKQCFHNIMFSQYKDYSWIRTFKMEKRLLMLQNSDNPIETVQKPKSRTSFDSKKVNKGKFLKVSSLLSLNKSKFTTILSFYW